jgi:hypothetical protein
MAMSDPFLEHLEKCSREVATWPAWKRNAFGGITGADGERKDDGMKGVDVDEKATCSNCPHWHPLAAGQNQPVVIGNRQGECRGGPPAVVPLLGPQGVVVLKATHRVTEAAMPACAMHPRYEAARKAEVASS